MASRSRPRAQPVQTALFDEPALVNAQASDATALSVQPQAAKALSPAARAFNRQLQRVQKLQTQLDDLERHCRAHQIALAHALQPLKDQHRSHLREMLGLLTPHLDGPTRGLTKTQMASLRDIVCNLTLQLLEQGEPGMAELHDRYSPLTLAQKRQADADAIRETYSQMMGQDLELQPDADPDDPEALVRATLEQLQAQFAAEQEERQVQAEARRAKRKPSAAQQQAAQALEDADTSLRQIYRQLASALHPDREPDEAARRRKTALMGEANAAYERKDLVALLRLQLQAELVDPDHLERVSEERLNSLTVLLKQQVAELERQRQAEQQRWMATFELPWGMTLEPQHLKQLLQADVHGWQEDLAAMQADLDKVRELPTLKKWLTEQRRLAQQAERQQHRVPVFDDDFDPWP